MTDLPLAASFAPASHDDWVKKAQLALKGVSLDKLTKPSRDGIAIRPLYARSETPAIAARAGGVAWQLVQRVDAGDPVAANGFALEDLQGGANALAVQSGLAQWEIVQAGQAELVAPGRYRLTRLLRGQRGTEAAMGNPTSHGARVVVLDGAVVQLPIGEAELGLPWNWRIGPAMRSPSDETFAAVSFTPQGIGLRPFRPAHLRVLRQADGALAIRWVRRTRDLAGDNWTLPEVPLGETAERYDLEIFHPSGALLRSVIGLAEPQFIYTAAMIAADLADAAPRLTVRVCQIGRLGRGAFAEVTQQL